MVTSGLQAGPWTEKPHPTSSINIREEVEKKIEQKMHQKLLS